MADPASSSDGRFKQLLTAPYDANGVALDGQFWFDAAAKLTAIELVAKDPEDCPRLVGSLRNAYGMPTDEAKGAVDITSWRDLKNGNAVSIAVFKYGTGCQVGYRRIEAAGAPGGL